MKTNLVQISTMPIMVRFFSKAVLLIFMIFCTVSAYSQTWSSLSSGMNSWVYSTVVYNGELIAGGLFTTAGGVSSNHIARWNGATWAPLGTGINGKVNALTVYKGNLVAAGEFTDVGGLQVNFIAQWDGTAWNDDLGGVGSIVTSLAVIGDTLYAGGYFVEADNTPVQYIAKRDTAGWVPLGSGMGGIEGQVMALTVHNGELYAGGFFTTAGGISANHIAKWDGTSWSSLGTGINHIVYSLIEYNGNLVAGGLFMSAGGQPANNIASWNGTSWSALGGGMNGPFYKYVLALTVYNNNLIAGGYFTQSDGLPTNGIAKWNGSAWSGLAGGLFEPGNLYGAHTLCVYGSDLIAGGIFNSAGSTYNVGNIAAWNEPNPIPVMLNIQNEIVANGSSNCYNAIQTITTAGGGATFVVQNGGIATLIAGQNIVFLPGTKVDSGGYMFGNISTNNQYCGIRAPPLVPLLNGADLNPVITMKSTLKVFPNPSNGSFILELSNDQKSGKSTAEVFNTHGEKVLTTFLNNETRNVISLNAMPSGVYNLRVISELSVETIKIIKQ